MVCTYIYIYIYDLVSSEFQEQAARKALVAAAHIPSLNLREAHGQKQNFGPPKND